MKQPMRVTLLLGIFMTAAASAGVPTAAVRLPRIELLREAEVNGAKVLLSDLLPEDAQGPLRAGAGEISLGAAPQPGNTRILDRNGILEEIAARPDVAERVSVPERIVVSREARPVTAAEALAAIQDALRRDDIPSTVQLDPGDVLLQREVLVAPGDAGLKVLRADFDAAMGRGRFLLRASKNPGVLPFFVVARLEGDLRVSELASMNEAKRAASAPALQRALAARRKADFLVSPEEPATLWLHSGGVQMIAEVVPLDKGAMGQRVRVQVRDTGKIFVAQVDGRGHVEVKF